MLFLGVMSTLSNKEGLRLTFWPYISNVLENVLNFKHFLKFH